MTCQSSQIHMPAEGSRDMMPDIVPALTAPDCQSKVVIAGPCSAESEQQTLRTATELNGLGMVHMFRAGLWKPRTRPGCFEGCGAEGLPWLKKVKELTGLPVATEVATSAHVQAAVEAGIDAIWLGARTTVNPFAVQEIADTLARCGTDVAVFVKNPATPDLELWIGAMQRLYNAGVRRMSAIHRGFSVYGPSEYRNPPQWSVPIELHRRMPHLQLIFDPSHTGGRRDMVAVLAREAYNLGFDGLIVESHCEPDTALSDAAQQITPAQLDEVLRSLVAPLPGEPDMRIKELRAGIDRLDSELLEVIARRMQLSDEIGQLKMHSNIPVLQPSRYDDLMKTRLMLADKLGLDSAMVSAILRAIHAASVSRQLRQRDPGT